MIVHNDRMANGVNSGIHTNALINGRLKLPPIATDYSDNKHDNNYRTSYVNVNLSSCRQSTAFPRVGAESLNSTFVPIQQVYTVLPPIGKALQPSAPSQARVAIPSAPGNSSLQPKRASRRPRIRKQNATELRNVSNENGKNANVSELVVENASLITKSVSPLCGSETTDSESIEINFTRANNERKAKTRPSDAVKSESSGEDGNCDCLAPNAIHATLNETPAKRDIGSQHENYVEIETLFPQFSNIPDDLRLYADVYPSSPPPHDRKAKIVVEKTRKLIQEDNCYRISFMEDVGYRRRNATCAELDEVLKNAVQLLKDVFLKRTMEELCMLW